MWEPCLSPFFITYTDNIETKFQKRNEQRIYRTAFGGHLFPNLINKSIKEGHGQCERELKHKPRKTILFILFDKNIICSNDSA